MADFQYDPVEGWENETEFPDYPLASEVRPLFQRLFNQIRDVFNTHKAETATSTTQPHGLAKNKLDATTAPTVNDDSGDGYSVNSMWLDTTNDKAYICLDAALGASIWQKVGGDEGDTVDKIITVGIGKNFSTVQGAVDSIKKLVNASITINVDAGTYAEDIIFTGFYGKGIITINGGNSLATAVNYIVKSMTISNCMVRVKIKGFTANTTTGIAFAGVISMYPDFAWCRTVVSATSQFGFFTQNAFVNISECEASNKNYGLYASICSIVLSSNWAVGSGNVVGLRALDAATIGKSGTQPQGTTAEQQGTGGVIR
jgi:hypothetical protein